MEYNFKHIEKKWQEYWINNDVFKAEDFSNKPKYYILDMFPYPSSYGLHVGHIEGYTATDIICRYKKMCGFNVLHPIGWDAFGLPAEQYAIDTGINPKISISKNIKNFKRQIKMHGFGYDWNREINTTDSKYYKWTQWIFIKLYKKKLAYLDEVLVNWCPTLGTVLANEEIVNGKSERGNYDVVKRPMKQWLLRITKYAERLLEDLNDLDWPNNIKEMQRNWIGKSIGVIIKFRLLNENDYIEIYTTRPDTIFGVTAIALAKDYFFLQKISSYKNFLTKKVKEYILKEETNNLLNDKKYKSGVFTGLYVINPVNDEKIPIWISNYVIITNDIGAVMVVPSHDKRDFDFATKFSLSKICVISPNNIANNNNKNMITNIINGAICYEDNNGIIINSKSNKIDINNITVFEAKEKITNWIISNKIGFRKVNYRLKDWIFSRQRYWGEPFPVVHMEDGSIKILDEKDLPLILPDVDVRSLRYSFNKNCASPLINTGKWLDYKDPITNQCGKIETNTMPQWAGSCWYYLRYLDPYNDQHPWDSDKEKYWMPVDLYLGGAEHAVLHLLYVRFWHKVLYDLGYVSTKEPFLKLVNQGMILGLTYKNPNGNIIPYNKIISKNNHFYDKETGDELISFPAKMSKSLKNVINPDNIIKLYGADSVRLYEMFIGPFHSTKLWDTNGIIGVHRFLKKVWKLIFNFRIIEDINITPQQFFILHNIIKKVTDDTKSFNFNTAISSMMIFINNLLLNIEKNSVAKIIIEIFLKLLSPYAPHICDELWEHLGHSKSIIYSKWPEYDKKYLIKQNVKIPIQINGKLRMILNCVFNISELKLKKIVFANSKIIKIINNKKIEKIIYIKNRLFNIVIH